MVKKFFFVIFLILISSCFCKTQAFVFGLKSSDNTVNNIIDIEKNYNLYLPLVGFIFDPWDNYDVIGTLQKMKEQLGNKRIYHITVSPNSYSVQEVKEGKFDQEYTQFFKTIKDLNLKVIFRTMHEMNGGRYPRSSNPEAFKQAWIHVRELSRSLGLDSHNILFDFSVNHRDMPTLGTPSQKATLIECKQYSTLEKKYEKLKKKKNPSKEERKKINEITKKLNKLKNCYRFEDYFPGNDYVDIVGVTFYNWGKATSNRQRKTPNQILNDPERNTLQRLKTLGEPLFIDEVGSTAVRYNSGYNATKSRGIYNSTGADERKNERLKDLSLFLSDNHFLGALYFNVDYTEGLKYELKGEADRAIINLALDKFYQGFRDLYSQSQSDFTSLLTLFGLSTIEILGKTEYVPRYTVKNINKIDTIINNHFSGNIQEISNFYNNFQTKKTGQASFDEAIEILAQKYNISN